MEEFVSLDCNLLSVEFDKCWYYCENYCELCKCL